MKTALVVEDDNSLRRLIQTILMSRLKDHKVSAHGSVFDFQNTLQQPTFRSEDITLCLSDYDLGNERTGVDVFATLSQVVAPEQLDSLPCILMSSFESDDARIQAALAAIETTIGKRPLFLSKARNLLQDLSTLLNAD